MIKNITALFTMFEKVNLPTVNIIQKHGYAFEIHNVITDDGYILEMHRIPCSRSGQKPTRNYPVFIHHGILESSANWILGGPKYSLDRFGIYDYGSKKNKKHYNAVERPSYDLKSIKVPITLMYGHNDLLSDKIDVMNLKRQFPKLIDAFSVDNPYCNHVDFLWSKNVKEVVNDPVKKIIGMTDDVNWVYTGPKHFEPHYISIGPTPPTPQTHPNIVPDMDYFEKNLDSIIANVMPLCVNENDKVEFEQERDRQKTMFLNLIKLVKFGQTEDGQLPDDFPAVVSNWNDDQEIIDL